jgi:hypothetical protein
MAMQETMDAKEELTMDTSVAHEETLADVLSARARRTPMDRLVLDMIGGVLIAAATLWARPTAWVPLLAAAACFAFYGCWAVTERRLHTEPGRPTPAVSPAWHVVRQASAVLGLTAFVTLLFALLGVALGPMIS